VIIKPSDSDPGREIVLARPCALGTADCERYKSKQIRRSEQNGTDPSSAAVSDESSTTLQPPSKNAGALS